MHQQHGQKLDKKDPNCKVAVDTVDLMLATICCLLLTKKDPLCSLAIDSIDQLLARVEDKKLTTKGIHIVHLVLTQVETVDERESWAIFALATASANQGGR